MSTDESKPVPALGAELGTGPSASSVGRGLLASAALIAAVTAVSRVIGFGRWLVFSSNVGADCVGDAYTRANILPNLLFEVVAGGALASAVVPLLAGPLTDRSREQVDRIVSALIGWVLLVLVPVSVLLAVLAVPLSKVLVEDTCLIHSGQGELAYGGQQELVARMIVVFAPQIALYGIGVVLTGTLTAHRRFFWPAAVPLMSSLVVIGAYLMYGATSGDATSAGNLPGSAEAWLTWGTTAGVALMTLPLLLPTRRAGVRIRPTLTFPPGVARRGLVLAGAGISALLAQQAALLVALALSRPEPNSYQVFQYAQAVYLLPYAVLAVPLATSAFPRLAERASRGDDDGFAATAASSTRMVVLVSLFGTAVLAGAALPVGEFFTVLDRAGESSTALDSMGTALTAMAPGLIGFALIAHIGRALYARERGRAAAVATALGWAAVIAGSVAGVRFAPVVTGLAWGNTIGMSVAGVLLVLALRRVAGPAAVAGLGRVLLLGGASALVAALAGREAAHLLLDARDATVVWTLLTGALAAGAAALVFAGLLAVLDRRNLGMLIARLTRRTSS